MNSQLQTSRDGDQDEDNEGRNQMQDGECMNDPCGKKCVEAEELEPNVRAVLLRIRPKVYHQLMRDRIREQQHHTTVSHGYT